MKFYRVDGKASDPTEESRYWFTSKREAEKRAREVQYGDYDARIEEVVIGFNKADMLAFLRDNLWQNPYWEAK